MALLFTGRIRDPETGEDLTQDVCEELRRGVNLQRIRAMKKQREAARLRGYARIIRDAKGNAIASPKAFIHPDYYHSVMQARKDENRWLREHDANTWQDEEFLKWELKNNDALRPRFAGETRYFQLSEKGRNAPVFNPSFSLNRPDLLVV